MEILGRNREVQLSLEGSKLTFDFKLMNFVFKGEIPFIYTVQLNLVYFTYLSTIKTLKENDSN